MALQGRRTRPTLQTHRVRASASSPLARTATSRRYGRLAGRTRNSAPPTESPSARFATTLGRRFRAPSSRAIKGGSRSLDGAQRSAYGDPGGPLQVRTRAANCSNGRDVPGCACSVDRDQRPCAALVLLILVRDIDAAAVVD